MKRLLAAAAAIIALASASCASDTPQGNYTLTRASIDGREFSLEDTAGIPEDKLTSGQREMLSFRAEVNETELKLFVYDRPVLYYTYEYKDGRLTPLKMESLLFNATEDIRYEKGNLLMFYNDDNYLMFTKQKK